MLPEPPSLRSFQGTGRCAPVRIAEFLKAEAIVPELNAQTKGDILKELSSALAKTNPAISATRLASVLEERERVNSTGVGEGVAIPHGKLPELSTLTASFGVARAGIDFEAHDHKPTFLFFALVAPENSAGLHLKALARISRLFRNPSFREAILQARGAAEIYALIIQEDAKA
jgi:PTS system nitrogen regulatory IIA component